MKAEAEIAMPQAPPLAFARASRSGPSVIAIDDVELLEDYCEAWNELASEALEPNPFYESWMLMPALRAFATNKDVRMVLVLRIEHQRPVLCGVFPLERVGRYKGLPIAGLRFWRHLHCGLCTPLIRGDGARQCLNAFLDWLASESGSSVMEFNLVSGDGAFDQLLAECLIERGTGVRIIESFTRALLVPAETADQYLETAISAKHRREMGRMQRRLSRLGRLDFDTLERDGDIDSWVEEFLRVEACGWKGRQGSALACDEINRDYFADMAREAFRTGRLMMSAMRLNGEPIAQRLSLIAKRGAFAFKTAYDERYASYSPGTLLEIENIRALHASSDVDWMDSCGPQEHFINRLWTDSRTIKSLLVSTGNRTGRLAVRLWPLLRSLSHRLKTKSD